MRSGILTIIFCLSISACGLRSIPIAKNDVDAAIAEVTNQYKRRADLVPSLVEVVKGYAKHERETLEQVIGARAKATQITLDPKKVTPESLTEFQKAQGNLTQALGRLMVIVERYPDLKANQNFRDLQIQLEGTENRIAVARKRNIDAIKKFNDLVSAPPESWTNSLVYHHEKLAQWTLPETERARAEQPPSVKF